MESKIIKQEKNPFLDREEFVLEIEAEVPPTFEQAKELVKSDNELTVVKKVQGKFGTNKFIAEIYVYENADSKGKVEVIPKKVRKKMEEERKAAEEAAKKAEAEAAAAKAAEEAAAKEAENAEESNEEAKAE